MKAKFFKCLARGLLCGLVVSTQVLFAAEGLFPKMPAAPMVYAADCRKNSEDSKMTARALAGLVNQKAAEAYVIATPNSHEQLKYCGKPFEILSAPEGRHPGLRALFQKYQGRVKKMFLYDPDKNWTFFLALMAGAQQEGIPVTEEIRDALMADTGWTGEVEDFRNRWAGPTEAYDWALKHLMPGCSRQVVFIPKLKNSGIVDYVVATKGFAFRLDFFNAEAEQVKKIFRAKPYGLGTSLMGYAGDEANVVANQYGIGYVVSDFYSNGSFWSSFLNKTYTQSPGKARRAEPGKIYASIMWSDGDNIAFDQEPLFNFWHSNERGNVPVATPLSPTLQELNSPLLDWYYAHLTDNDELMAGSTGVQFIYIRDYNEQLFPAWCQLSRRWCADAGFHSVRIWIAPRPSAKYSVYMANCGMDGVFGEGWTLKTGFPPKIETYGVENEDKLYEAFTNVAPNPQSPVFVNFTPIVAGFDHGGGGYRAIQEQVERLQKNFPERYVFMLPKDQLATLKAYYDGLEVKQIEVRPDKSDGLKAVSSGDGKFTIAERDGDKCWLVPKQAPPKIEYFYLDAADEFRPKPGQMLEIELEYLDVGTGQVSFEYDSTDLRAPLGGAYKGYGYNLRRANTGKWLTGRFYVKDAGFGGLQNDGADFRFQNQGDELFIRAVRVKRTGK